MNEEQNIMTADKPALQIASVSGCYSFTIRNTKQSSAVFGTVKFAINQHLKFGIKKE